MKKIKQFYAILPLGSFPISGPLTVINASNDEFLRENYQTIRDDNLALPSSEKIISSNDYKT